MQTQVIINTELAAARTGTIQRITSPALNSDTSDEALIRSIAKGDRQAMAVIYARHNVRVYRFILRLTGNTATAEDLVSEVFLDVWRSASRFEAKSSVATWLMAIARYKALSAMRQRIDAPLDGPVAESVEEGADDPEMAADAAIRSEIIHKSLMQLSPAHREVMDLVYYHDKSVDEIAQIVGISPGTVKTRMFYARAKLAGLLRGAGVDSL
jgi:RNA polymerase sigma-70 factor (ECF subfamily)